MTGARLFHVYRDEARTRIDVDGDLLGWGVQFATGWCFIEWNREAFPPDDRLEHDHWSIYGSIDDVEQGTGGLVRFVDDVVEDAVAELRSYEEFHTDGETYNGAASVKVARKRLEGQL